VSMAFGYDAGEAFRRPRAMKRPFDVLPGVGSSNLVHLYSAITGGRHPAGIFGALGSLLLPALAWTTIFTTFFETTI